MSVGIGDPKLRQASRSEKRIVCHKVLHTFYPTHTHSPLLPPLSPKSPRGLVSGKQDGRQWKVARGSWSRPCAGGASLNACAGPVKESALSVLVWRFGLVLCRVRDASVRSGYVESNAICCEWYSYANPFPAVKVIS